MRRIIIPALVLVAAAAVWLVQSRIESRRISGKSIDNFLSLNPAEIEKVTVKTPGGSFSFLLINGRWVMEGEANRPLDSSAVGNMISAASSIKVGSIISENLERQRDFMVDSINGNLVQFFKGDRLLSSVFVGKMSSDFAHTYVRKPGSREVYLADGMITYAFNRPRSQWFDKSILKLDPDSVAGAEFVYPDKAFRLSRSGAKWFIAKKPFSDSLQADSTKTSNFIYQISRLAASDFAVPADSGLADFSKPTMILQVTMANGTRNTIDIAGNRPDATRFFCRKEGVAETFVLHKGVYDSILKEFSSFLP